MEDGRTFFLLRTLLDGEQVPFFPPSVRKMEGDLSTNLDHLLGGQAWGGRPKPVCATSGVKTRCSVACMFSLEKARLRETMVVAVLAGSLQPPAKTRPKLNGKGWVNYCGCGFTGVTFFFFFFSGEVC